MPALLCKLFEGKTLDNPFFEPRKVPSMFVPYISPQERALAIIAVPPLAPFRGRATPLDPG